MLDGLVEALPSVDARCVVLTGEGDVFSAGYDIADLAPERLAEEAAELLTHPFEAALAALDAVAGAGRRRDGRARVRRRARARAWRATCGSARRGARLGMPPARLGVVYSHTGLRRFVDAIGSARTRELFLTARPVELGRGARVGPGQRGHDGRRGRARSRWRARSPRSSPLSVRGNKRVLQALVPPLDPALEAELHALRDAAFRSDDFAEGVRAFIEKRPPQWRGS